MSGLTVGHRWWLRPVWLVLFFTLAACADEPPPTPQPITPTAPVPPLQIGLASSAGSLREQVGAPYLAYAQSAGLAAVEYTTANYRTLLTDLSGGLLDAALVHLVPDGRDLWFSPVALDGLVVVVHPDNPVTSLTPAEIQALFSGRIANWAALGGPGQDVMIYSREPGSGTRLIFDQRLMAEQRVSINAQIISGDDALLAAVADDPAAVGYSMMGSASGVKMVAIDGLAPTPDAATTQSYPYTVPLYFVSPAEPQGTLRAYLAWLQSPTGQTLLGAKFGRVR
jgi:hypothetical protein